MLNITNCGKNASYYQKPVQWYFYPSYFALFFLSLLLNFVFINSFIKYRRRLTFKFNIFNYLTFNLIIIDFTQSIVLLIDILLIMIMENRSENILLEGFLSLRNCLISCHAITLLFMATNRYRAIKHPQMVNDPRSVLIKLYRIIYVTISIPFLVRFALVFCLRDCLLLQEIDNALKMSIGIATALVVMVIICIYSVLFGLLCCRNFPSTSKPTGNFSKIHPYPNERKSTTVGKVFKRHFGKSVKFAQVLFSITILMMISYAPVFLTNVNLIKYPGQAIYYLFYLPVLGDPLILILSREDIRQEMIRPFSLTTSQSVTNIYFT
uniref:GCR156 n=1 Tax=Schmidtea mediterranea TaxID=79327 RepID=A0A193KUR6_SCHMD|nr:GCR156 [Schmidtea mediterranea]